MSTPEYEKDAIERGAMADYGHACGIDDLGPERVAAIWASDTENMRERHRQRAERILTAARPAPSSEPCPHCSGTRTDTITASNGGVGEVAPCWACSATVTTPPRRSGNYEQASRLVESYALGVETDLPSVMDRLVTWLTTTPSSEPGDAEGDAEDRRLASLEGKRVRVTNGEASGRQGVAFDWDEDRGILFVDLDSHQHLDGYTVGVGRFEVEEIAPPSPASEPEGPWPQTRDYWVEEDES